MRYTGVCSLFAAGAFRSRCFFSVRSRSFSQPENGQLLHPEGTFLLPWAEKPAVGIGAEQDRWSLCSISVATGDSFFEAAARPAYALEDGAAARPAEDGAAACPAEDDDAGSDAVAIKEDGALPSAPSRARAARALHADEAEAKPIEADESLPTDETKPVEAGGAMPTDEAEPAEAVETW